MGFWIFMLIMDLLLPFTMIGFGRYFMKKAPKEINSVFGYRTSMSMKNKDTWKFAHKYCGNPSYAEGCHCFAREAYKWYPILRDNRYKIYLISCCPNPEYGGSINTGKVIMN